MESMKNQEKGEKSSPRNMRSLHRDIGFFVIGLTIIYAMSGIILTFRTTDFLKHETHITKNIGPNLKATELGAKMQVRSVNILRAEGDLIYFENGTYNTSTGIVDYNIKELPALLNNFNKLHKLASNSAFYVFNIVYGILLLFLAISSFWMFKPSTKLFRRGISIFAIGAVIAFTVIFLI